MRFIIYIAVFFCALSGLAQTVSLEEFRPKYDGTIAYKEIENPKAKKEVPFTNQINDSLVWVIDSLSNIYKTKPVFIQGYTVLAYNGADLNIAKQIKGKILSKFPEEETNIEYKSPNAQLKIGSFQQKIYADVLQEKLSSAGFTGLIVVPEKIKIRD